MNKDVKKYFKECKFLFSVYGKKEKAYLNKVKENVISDDTITYDELIERFGTPKDIVIDYYEQQDTYELIKNSKIVKQVKKYFIIFLIILSIFLLYKTYIYQKTYEEIRDFESDYFEEVIE